MTTKQQAMFYLPKGTVDDIRSRATAAGSSASAVADLFLRYASQRITPEALAAWAKSQPTPRARPAAPDVLAKRDRDVLATLKQLREKSREGATRFEAREVAVASGMPFREAYRALAALEVRGLVASSSSPQVDAWGRPVESFWWEVVR